MSFSTLPLSYCTNVHPALNVHDVLEGIRKYASPIQQACGEPIAAGLWLAALCDTELKLGDYQLQQLKEMLEQEKLINYTLKHFLTEIFIRMW